jgi:uncharacterized protein with HEPN domain
MLDAATEAIEFTTGVTLAEFEEDRKLQLAVVQLIEVVGEASKYLR